MKRPLTTIKQNELIAVFMGGVAYKVNEGHTLYKFKNDLFQ